MSAVTPIYSISIGRAMDGAPLRPIHWKIWFLSAMGIFLDGFDLFIIGVALPLIVSEMVPSPMMQGMIGAAAVLGAVLGASLGGFLTDRFGRKAIYLVDLAFFIIFSILTACAWDATSLIVFRFLLGVGIGADYPICASYISSFMPARIRGRMLIGAFSFQALGMVAAAAVGLLILWLDPNPVAWRWMLASGAVPAIVILILRASVPEGARWYAAHGRIQEAAKVVELLVPERRAELESLRAQETSSAVREKKEDGSYRELFSSLCWRRTVLAAVPWFLMDVATYGVGIFTPTILAALVFTHKAGSIASSFTSMEGSIFASTEAAVFLDLFLVAGFLANIALIEKWGRIKLQIMGFAGMFAGLVILSCAALQPVGGASHMALVFSGFILFNVLMNMGPNSTTFILPAELFPTRLRASGHGFASASAKLGAALGIFFMPILKAGVGISVTLVIMSGVCLVGLLVTILFRIETAGRSLEELN